MGSFVHFFNKMNLLLWVLGILVVHAAMYFLLGTDTWLATALLATSVWGVILLVIKAIAKQYTNREKDIY